MTESISTPSSSVPGQVDPGSASKAVADARDRRRNDPAWQQIRAEREIAAPYMKNFEPRIILESLWAVVGWALAGIAGVAGWAPYWLTVPIASIFVWTLYMPLHEATHNNIQGRHTKLRWLNDSVGHLASIPIMFSFKGHQISHMKHHAHTNEPGKDPDLRYSGPFLTVLGRLLMLLTVGYFFLLATWLPPMRERMQRALAQDSSDEIAPRDEEEFLHDRRFHTLTFFAMVAIALAGYPVEVFMFWFLPSRLGNVIIALLVAWLPHHPHVGHGRYTNTRVTLFPGSGIIGRGHDRHIIHHMIPPVPHYRIPDVFEKLRPILEERGTRIEGPSAGPGSPKLVLGWDDEQVAALEREAALADARPFA